MVMMSGHEVSFLYASAKAWKSTHSTAGSTEIVNFQPVPGVCGSVGGPFDAPVVTGELG